MDLNDAINHPKINVFDITTERKGRVAFTYKKPCESDAEYLARCEKNQKWVERNKKGQA